MAENKTKKSERKDAYRIKDIDAFHSIVPYVMPKRTEAEVYMHESIDVTSLLSFLEKYNKENNTNLKIFHAVCMAVAKTVYFRPLLNTFISGRRFWMRNDISLSFVAKRQFADGAEESIMTLIAKPEENITDISKTIVGDVERVRKQGSNSLDALMGTIGKMPRFLLTFFFFVLKRLEYHGKMPSGLTDGDANYTSVLLSNLGSISCGAPYHHLSNYGTNSLMITIGVIRKEIGFDENGNQCVRDMLDMGITLDERIADGFYFARSFKLVKHLFANPELLLLSIGEDINYDFS